MVQLDYARVILDDENQPLGRERHTQRQQHATVYVVDDVTEGKRIVDWLL